MENEVKEVKEEKKKAAKKEKVAKKAILNEVEGFNPEDYVETFKENGQKYLTVFYRKMWFRLKYPMGKITTELVSITNDNAIIKASVYADKEDINPLATAYAMRTVQIGNEIQEQFLECTETAAIGRALTNAGFNIVPYGTELEDHVVDMPISLQKEGISQIFPQANSATSKVNGESISLPASAIQAPVNQTVNPQMQTLAGQVVMPQPQVQPIANQAVVPQSQGVSVAEIPLMDYEAAKNFNISVGKYAGWSIEKIITLSGDIKYLEWILNSDLDITTKSAVKTVLATFN